MFERWERARPGGAPVVVIDGTKPPGRLGAEEALDRVQAYAETRTTSIVSPETDPQRDQVRAFFAAVRGGPSHV